MRLWSLHPRHPDSRGLVALWREGLLAQAVLKGATRGYRHHPQLARFRARVSQLSCIGAYLWAVHAQSLRRGLRFDPKRIVSDAATGPIDVTRGPLSFEWRHLLTKLEVRAPEWLEEQAALRTPSIHPLFRVVPGDVENWERP